MVSDEMLYYINEMYDKRASNENIQGITRKLMKVHTVQIVTIRTLITLLMLSRR